MLENNDNSCKSNFSVHPNTPDAPVCPFSFESSFEHIFPRSEIDSIFRSEGSLLGFVLKINHEKHELSR
jgi:hypothetical protein